MKKRKVQIAVSAPASSSGKTFLVCGLLEILKRKGLFPCAFKTGPDYIDPMFHRSVLNVSSHNLDLVMSDESYVRSCYQRELAEHGSAVVEGVMGLYDGLSGKTDRGSCWHLANTLDIPVLLVLNPSGSSLSAAAEVKGLQQFRPDSRIAVIILNRCKKSYAGLMKEILEQETGIPVVGYLPELPDVHVESRHLGLYQADEIEDLQQNIKVIADAMEEHLDWKKIESLFSVPVPSMQEDQDSGVDIGRSWVLAEHVLPVIALARDEAFTFCYQETQEELDRQGGNVVYFSPVHEPYVPEDADAIVLPGGYPELYARQLSENRSMRDSIRKSICSGMPVIAECGGFLYLQKFLRDADGALWPMAGVFPGTGRSAGKLVRFGYAEMQAKEDSLLFKRGESMSVHEFHYWKSDEDGDAFQMKKPLSSRNWSEGYAGPSWYAGFPHLYLAAHPQVVKRFICAAEAYRHSQMERNRGGF